MARWHTHNRRVRRKRERDARLMANSKLLVPALETVVRDALRAAFVELANRMNEIAAAWVSACQAQGWLPLDPKYAGARRRREEWPEVVYEDVLDAEFIE